MGGWNPLHPGFAILYTRQPAPCCTRTTGATLALPRQGGGACTHQGAPWPRSIIDARWKYKNKIGREEEKENNHNSEGLALHVTTAGMLRKVTVTWSLKQSPHSGRYPAVQKVGR